MPRNVAKLKFVSVAIKLLSLLNALSLLTCSNKTTESIKCFISSNLKFKL